MEIDFFVKGLRKAGRGVSRWLGTRADGMVFLAKAGILTGAFYVQSIALFITAGLMAIFPDWAHIIFGAVSAACFFFPGLKYYRQRWRGLMAALH